MWSTIKALFTGVRVSEKRSANRDVSTPQTVARPLPEVTLAIVDLEVLERQNRLPSFDYPAQWDDPFDLEFEFEVLNTSGVKVGCGKLDKIAGRQINVYWIEIEKAFQKHGFAKAAVLKLHQHFEGLAIAPVLETSTGEFLWTSLRNDPRTSTFIKDTISRTEATLMLDAARVALKTGMHQ